MAAAQFAAIAITLYIAHMVGDHWVQYHTQSQQKGTPGISGRFHCFMHVVTHTITTAVFVGAVWWRLDLQLDPTWVAIGLTVNAVTHYIADRRTPIRKLARFTGKKEFVELKSHGMNGAYLLDQSWHIGWLLPVALIIS